MLLIIFLGLIAMLSSVSGNCDLGASKVKNFDWNKLGNTVLTRFLKEAAIKTNDWFYILFVVPSANSQ